MTPVFYPYSCDSNERRHFVAFAATFAILIVYGLHAGRNTLSDAGIQIPWYFETPTFALVTWGLYRGATHYAWRYGWFRLLFGVRMPDLNGHWTGHLVSSFAPGRQIPCSLNVEQTWDSIGLMFETEGSRSYNGITGISVRTPGGPRIVYEYANVPKVMAANQTMFRHEGTQWLSFSENSEKEGALIGDYYTGRDRQTYGTVHLIRSKPT